MRMLILVLVVLMTGCAVKDTQVMSLIAQTAERAPAGIDGEFVLNIKATGQQGPRVYLNTELDYRDRRNVTVVLTPEVARYFATTPKASPLEYFLNKRLRIKGTAKQVTIWFFKDGERSEKYYYQTHINIDSHHQIEVLNH